MTPQERALAVKDIMFADETRMSKKMVIKSRLSDVQLQARDDVILDLSDDPSDIHALSG